MLFRSAGGRWHRRVADRYRERSRCRGRACGGAQAARDAEEALRAANEKVEEAARAAANGAIVASRAGLESFESLPALSSGGDLKALEAASGTSMPMGRSAVPRGRRLPPRQPTAAARRVAEARTAFSTFPRTTKSADGMSASDGGDESSSPGQKRKSIAVEDIGNDDLPKVNPEEEAELKEKQVKAARERAVRRVRAVRRAAAASTTVVCGLKKSPFLTISTSCPRSFFSTTEKRSVSCDILGRPHLDQEEVHPEGGQSSS